MKKLLKFLSGKKSIIAGVITTTSAFLVSQGMITPEIGTFVNALSLVLFGAASVATGKLVYNK